MIVALFIVYVLHLDLSEMVAPVFIVAMPAFVVACMSFLRGIFRATTGPRFGRYQEPARSDMPSAGAARVTHDGAINKHVIRRNK